MNAVLATGVMGREAGFVHDVRAVAGRALRQIPREPAAVLPAVFVPAFFYAVNLGALEKLADSDRRLQGIPVTYGYRLCGYRHVQGPGPRN